MMCAHRRLGALAAALLAVLGPRTVLAAGPSDPRRSEARRAAVSELTELAARIESLKREVAAGRSGGSELEGLLARAQELAALIEKIDRQGAPAPAPRPAAPDAQELRERADAVRDRADRVAAALADVDRRIVEARHRAELERRLETLSAPGDLFAESAPRRRSTGAPAGAASEPAPSFTPSAPAGAPGDVRAAPQAGPPLTGPDVRSSESPIEGGDSVAALQRKRAEMAALLAALRSQVEALDSEVRAAEAGR